MITIFINHSFISFDKPPDTYSTITSFLCISSFIRLSCLCIWWCNQLFSSLLYADKYKISWGKVAFKFFPYFLRSFPYYRKQKILLSFHIYTKTHFHWNNEIENYTQKRVCVCAKHMYHKHITRIVSHIYIISSLGCMILGGHV